MSFPNLKKNANAAYLLTVILFFSLIILSINIEKDDRETFYLAISFSLSLLALVIVNHRPILTYWSLLFIWIGPLVYFLYWKEEIKLLDILGFGIILFQTFKCFYEHQCKNPAIQSFGLILWGQSFLYIILVWFSWWTFESAVNMIDSKNPLSGSQKQFPDIEKSHLGISLSGGGLRAAVFHAGVLNQLKKENIIPRFVSTVSGGSIIGAFYVMGGKLEQFREITVEGLNLKQFLMEFPQPLKLFFTNYSRVDGQSELLRHRLFGNQKIAELKNDTKIIRPELLINTTDISNGLLVGWMPSSYILYGLPRWINDYNSFKKTGYNHYTVVARNLRNSEAYKQLPLSILVAASGAFPGAFDRVSLRKYYKHLKDENTSINNLEQIFALADGGIIDNSGTSLLLATHAKSLVPDKSSFIPKAFKKLNLILESDGSAIIESTQNFSAYKEIMRSIDVNYAQSQVANRIVNRESAENADISIVRISPSQFYMPKPLYTQKQLKFTYKEICKIGKSPHIFDLKKRIIEENSCNNENKIKTEDYLFMLDIYQQKLIELKVRYALLYFSEVMDKTDDRPDEEIINSLNKMIELYQSNKEEVKEIKNDKIEMEQLIKMRAQFRTDTVQGLGFIKSNNPPMLDSESDKVRYAVSLPITPFDHKGLERVFEDIIKCFNTYRQTDTLDSRLSQKTSHQIFRLGRYLSLLSKLKISAALSKSSPSRWKEGKIIIAGKRYNESTILVELIANIIESIRDEKNEKKYSVEKMYEYGDTKDLFQALKQRKIDIYPEFSGSLLSVNMDFPFNSIKTPQKHETKRLNEIIATDINTKQLKTLERFRYNNPYVIVVKKQTATKNLLISPNISTLAKLHKENNYEIELITTRSFIERRDGLTGLEEAYKSLKFTTKKVTEHENVYSKLDETSKAVKITNKILPVAIGYATDFQLDEDQYLQLEDDKKFFPYYYASPLLNKSLLDNFKDIEAAFTNFNKNYCIDKYVIRFLLSCLSISESGQLTSQKYSQAEKIVKQFFFHKELYKCNQQKNKGIKNSSYNDKLNRFKKVVCIRPSI